MNLASLTRRTIPARVPSTVNRDVGLRSLQPGDSAAVLAVFAGMSPRSRELRFLAPKPRLTSADVRRLTAVDQRDHVALLATSAPDHQPIGIARFIRDRDDAMSAEVAVAIVDRWQHRGVGSTLLDALAQRAVEVGVRRFTALVSHDNTAVHRLLHRSAHGLSRIGIDRWTVEYAMSLEGELP
jgi:RimJ/RimL family protein N-acetyltransferase